MIRDRIAQIAFCLIGAIGLVSAIKAPPEYNYIDQRRNVTYTDVSDTETLRDALNDRFLGASAATSLHTRLIAAGLISPVAGAIMVKGEYFYTNFFEPAPVTAYRGLYTRKSESALAANAQAASLFARDMEACGIEFFQILHPTKPAGLRLYAERGRYRASDLEAFKAAVSPAYRDRILDLTPLMQELSASVEEEIYYPYGTHFNRLGADLVAVEISQWLAARGVIPKPLEPGAFSSPPVTDRVYDEVPPALSHIVDDNLTPMLWGQRERPAHAYPPAPDGLFEGLETTVDDANLITIRNPGALTQKRAVIIRDSFGSYLAPYFARMFAHVVLANERDYALNKEALDEADVVIFNHVARYLHYPRTYVPACNDGRRNAPA